MPSQRRWRDEHPKDVRLREWNEAIHVVRSLRSRLRWNYGKARRKNEQGGKFAKQISLLNSTHYLLLSTYYLLLNFCQVTKSGDAKKIEE